MPGSIWYHIAATPWWIYVAVGYALRVGFLAIKPRQLPVKNLYFLPGLLIGISLMCMTALIKSVTYRDIAIWNAMFLLGTGLGYLQYNLAKIKSDKKSQTLQIPGSFIPLIIICIVIASKFYFGYTIEISYLKLAQPENAFYVIAIYGLLSGLFIGRLGYAIRCIRNGPYVMINSTIS